MIKYFFLFTVLIYLVECQIAQYPFAQGELAQLDFGGKVKTWERNIDGKKQILKVCDQNDERKECFHWKDEQGKVLTETSKARVFENGSLILYSFQKSDQGDYTSPDAKGEAHSDGHGGFYSLGDPVIYAFLKESSD